MPAPSLTPLLRAYLAATAGAGPLAPALLALRRRRGKEDPARLPERLGRTDLGRPDGVLVWFHAASVGESLSLLPLLDRLLRERPDIHALVTSGTVTSATILAERLPPRALHQFAPVDLGSAVKRFLRHWRPDLAIWTESELWPRLILSTRARGVPMLLLNARLTARSLRRWRRAGRSAAALLAAFDCVLAQDDATARGLGRLGVAAGRLAVTGSIKQAARPLPCDAEQLDALRQAMRDRPVWLAASTHPGEEELALEAHRRHLRTTPEALLVIAPRHPARGEDVAATLDRSGLRWSRRREGSPTPDVAVYLADTLGEMGLWYRLAPISFVGGSFGGVGGHNPFEPAALGSAVLHGPDTHNFADIYTALDAAGAALPVGNAASLAAALVEAGEPERRAQMAEKARGVAAGGERALATALSVVLEHLPTA